MSKLEQLISDIEAYIDSCKYQAFSNSKIIVDKNQLNDMLSELRLNTPNEIIKYQKILNNKEAIIAEAKEQADTILSAAQIHTEELISEHEIMQQAYAQANELVEQAKFQAQHIVDGAVEDANTIRAGAVSYTDDMLSKLQYIIEHTITDSKEKYSSLISNLENVLETVDTNRRELNNIDSESSSDESAELQETNESSEVNIEIPLTDAITGN